MIPVHVVARSASHAEAFERNHPLLRDVLQVETGQSSLFRLLNRLLAESRSPVVCVVHDDVMLPNNFARQLQDTVEELNAAWPSWGLAGNAGVTTLRYGFGASNVVRYLADPHGGPNLAGHIIPAQTVDGNVMLLNIAAMRARQLRLPDFEGFQLYDIVLSIETLFTGLAVFVVPQLACWHGSKGNQKSFNDAAASPAFNAYLRSRLANRYIHTLNGFKTIPLGTRGELRQVARFDLDERGLQISEKSFKNSRTTIVVRTTFKRAELLRRCLDSVNAFIAADSADLFDYVLVSSEDPPQEFSVSPFIKAEVVPGKDSRFELVRCAVTKLTSTYVWFVDDDDWLFPNEASKISRAICSVLQPAAFFLDTQHFVETEVPGATGSYALSSMPGRKFSARDHFRSMSGENYSPFCSVIFPRSRLELLPTQAFDGITYYEDYMCVLHVLASGQFLTVSIDVLAVGISIRDSGNSVTLIDRSVWHQSMANLVSLVVADSANVMYSVPNALTKPASDLGAEAAASDLAHALHVVQALQQSSSWRITRPWRYFGKVFRKLTRAAERS